MLRGSRDLTLLFAAAFGCAWAQTAPCGMAVIRTEGSKAEDRFLASPPAHVRTAVLKALPVLAAKLHKEQGDEIEAKTDVELYTMLRRKNEESGVSGWLHRGLGAFGTFKIRVRPKTRDGQPGTAIHIEFHKNAMRGRVGNELYATPLADEVECLCKVLSPEDPARNPRGAGAPAAAGATLNVKLGEGTPIKLTLRDPVYSKKLDQRNPDAFHFEVAEDVQVDGAVAIHKGALATAHFLKVQKARGYGRHADIEFAFDTATAADGQPIKLAGAEEKSRGGRTDDTVQAVLFSPALGWLVKGNETLIRAGTTYDMTVSGEYTVSVAR